MSVVRGHPQLLYLTPSCLRKVEEAATCHNAVAENGPYCLLSGYLITFRTNITITILTPGELPGEFIRDCWLVTLMGEVVSSGSELLASKCSVTARCLQ